MRLRTSHVVRFARRQGRYLGAHDDRHDEDLDLHRRRDVQAARGRCVARLGAGPLLRPVAHVIALRVCAPLETRIRRMMERLATDDRDFVSCEIRASEEAHAAITRHPFGVAWHDAENDDLVLNTERLTVAEGVE
jgi:cytidylate kinase